MARPTGLTLSVVFDGILAAGETGLTMAEIADLGPAKARNNRANAGRHIAALARDGLIEHADDDKRWRISEAGRAKGSVGRQPKLAKPLVDRLPEAPPEAAPARQTVAERLALKADQIAAAAVDPVLLAVATPEEAAALKAFAAVHGIGNWETWLPAMFPKLFTADFGDHHREFWEWVWRVEPGVAQEAFIAVWNRGGAKSASVEAALVALAARGKRKYALYVSGTQALADEHVGNIGSMLESANLASAYPSLSERQVGQYGESKGWRRNRLRTAAGFTVDALGLDTAARGARIDEQRPDIIVLDDIDSDNDTPGATDKKIRAITRKLLPAGSQDCIVIFVQNMIHSQSIAARLARMETAPRIDFLAKRIVSGPIPAVYDLEWQAVDDHYEITGGTPSWGGMPLENCQNMLDLYGLTAFLVECQHVEADLSGGMFDHLDFSQDGPLYVTDAQVPRLRHIGVWVDPAVSSTKRSDSCGIVADGLGLDRRYYRLWSWERIASPIVAIKTALRMALELGAKHRPESLTVGVETNQGGDTWEVVYRQALTELHDEEPELFEHSRIPRYAWAKAGSDASKVERAARMQAAYELGRFRHVGGRVTALEAGLHRFPLYKPYDVVDAAYWSWRHLAGLGGEKAKRKAQTRAPRGSVPQVGAANLTG